MEVSKSDQSRHYSLPIYGGGVDILAGSLVKKSLTPGTSNGSLIQAGGTSAIDDAVGILEELHDYSVSGDTLIDGTTFVTRGVQILVPARIIHIEYSLATGDLITCTQAVNSTALTLTSLEDNIDAATLYVAEGTGAGQTNFLTASAAGSATLKAAFTTSLDTTSKLVKILPRFHKLLGLSADGTKLVSTAAAGAVAGFVLDSYIDTPLAGGGQTQLSPVKHAAMKNLNIAARLKFSADIVLHDTIVYPVA